jgi:hypothetical protein
MLGPKDNRKLLSQVFNTMTGKTDRPGHGGAGGRTKPLNPDRKPRVKGPGFDGSAMRNQALRLGSSLTGMKPGQTPLPQVPQSRPAGFGAKGAVGTPPMGAPNMGGLRGLLRGSTPASGDLMADAKFGSMDLSKPGAMMKKGGKVKSKSSYKSGGSVKASSASKRADGCAVKGKTKGRMV